MPPVNTTRFTLRGYSSAGRRLHGMQEVSGSIPLSSTKIQNPRFGGGFCFYLFSCKAFSA